MRIDRRTLLRLTGVSLLAVAGKKVASVLAAVVESGASAAQPPARRWAMVIDMPKCLKDESCTKCIAACHRLHNVPLITDSRHEVKWIWKAPFENVFPSQENAYIAETLHGKQVPVFCNHCADPPCVRVCPTQATWKRQDGVVMMDWHRCIGCRYCMVACPYGSRSFNWVDPRPHLAEMNPDFPTRTKGVVEKCILCYERLDKGQLPACVEACSEKAMVFGDLDDPASDVRRLLEARYSIRRTPELGTQPEIYYLV
jgi:Fe-S-cluster-containing dehydrogenase component